MTTILLSAFLTCPLLSGGIAPANISASNAGWNEHTFKIYINNTSAFVQNVTRVDVWVPDAKDKSIAHKIIEDLQQSASAPAHGAVEGYFQDAALDLNDIVGSSVEC